MNSQKHQIDRDVAASIHNLGEALAHARDLDSVSEVLARFRELGALRALDLVGEDRPRARADAAAAFYTLGLNSDASTILTVGAHLCAGAVPLLEFGAPALQDALRHPVLQAEVIVANAITEQEAGSDLTNLQTTAVRSGDKFVIHGKKRYVTNAPFADYAVVFCCTDREAGFLGASALLVDLRSPGVRIGAAYRMNGVPHAQVASISFENCEVAAENMLGNEGDGTRIFSHSMLWERTVMFSGLMGVLQRNLDAAIAFSTTRIQRGVPISKFQAVSHRLVDCAIDIEASKALIAMAVSEENPQRAALLAIQTKVACSETFVRVARKIASTFGGWGVQVDCPASQLMADSLAASSFSGANDTLRNAIASKIGL